MQFYKRILPGLGVCIAFNLYMYLVRNRHTKNIELPVVKHGISVFTEASFDLSHQCFVVFCVRFSTFAVFY